MMMTNEKTGLRYCTWKSPEASAVFLLVHGLGGHSDRWGFFVDYFLKQNFSSYAIELRGFGEAPGVRGHVDSFDIYVKDIQNICEIIRQENQQKKIIIVGESMGALIAFLAALRMPQVLSGLICISPVFKSRLRLGRFKYIKLAWYLAFNPKRQFRMPFTAGMCTHDSEYQKVMNADVREHRFATARLLFEVVRAQQKIKSARAGISLPILFLLAGSDAFVDVSVSKKVFLDLKVSDKEIIEYPKMRHALSIELGREKVFEDILKWLRRK